jgi:hypothetical protein
VFYAEKISVRFGITIVLRRCATANDGNRVYVPKAPFPCVRVSRSPQWESPHNVRFSDIAVHILSIGMLLLAFFGTLMHLAHREERRGLRLLHQPGTLASAAALTAQTPMAELLDGRQRPEEMSEALQNRRFRIDPHRNKIVTEGEAGYQEAVSPSGWRRSFFGAAFQGGGSSNGQAPPGPSP